MPDSLSPILEQARLSKWIKTIFSLGNNKPKSAAGQNLSSYLRMNLQKDTMRQIMLGIGDFTWIAEDFQAQSDSRSDLFR